MRQYGLQNQDGPNSNTGDFNTPKLCPIQLVENEEGLKLRARSENYQTTDENQDLVQISQLHSESSFTDVNQKVEKSVIDLFGVIQNEN